MSVEILAIHHVQLAMPAGREDEARAFYTRVLALPEVPKPPHLAKRGGCWFESDRARIHLGVEADFRPALKAHPALLVANVQETRDLAESLGYRVVDDEPLEGHDRAYLFDPFGNRIEILRPKA